MKAKYDGTWVWIPKGRIESLLFLEWLTENGHTLGKMVIIKSDSLDLESEEDWFKVYFEFPHKGLMKDLVEYINNNP